jgi:hypothetical protein
LRSKEGQAAAVKRILVNHALCESAADTPMVVNEESQNKATITGPD